MRSRDVRELFYVLGFTRAERWDPERLREMAISLPERIKRRHIPKEYLHVYDELVESSNNRTYLAWTRKNKLSPPHKGDF